MSSLQTNGKGRDPADSNDRREVSPLMKLDEMIASRNPILYKSRDFKDDDVVGQFVKDHRALRTAMIGLYMYAYVDPCHCCIPAYGSRVIPKDIQTPELAIAYIRECKDHGAPLDLVFLTKQFYVAIQSQVAEVSHETKLIVACGRTSNEDAGVLRRSGIPAIDENDYLNCAPLNAVIALTVFGELMEAAKT